MTRLPPSNDRHRVKQADDGLELRPACLGAKLMDGSICINPRQETGIAGARLVSTVTFLLAHRSSRSG